MNKHKYPEVCQKKTYHKKYFEGWYYKLVTANGKHSLSFIVGASYDHNSENAFIQCLHLGIDQVLRVYKMNCPIEDFSGGKGYIEKDMLLLF